MKKVHKIEMVIYKAGRGAETIIREHCPFKKSGHICALEHIECRYGLTEIVVPEPECPLKAGVTQEFNIQEENIDE